MKRNFMSKTGKKLPWPQYQTLLQLENLLNSELEQVPKEKKDRLKTQIMYIDRQEQYTFTFYNSEKYMVNYNPGRPCPLSPGYLKEATSSSNTILEQSP